MPVAATLEPDGIVGSFPRPSFAGLEFPAEEWSVGQAEFRHFLHEYPRVAGGQLEKLGRRPYIFSFEVPGQTVLNDAPRPYRNWYPTNALKLISIFETGLTSFLVVPGRGSIEAMCVSWPSKFSGKVQSGEHLTFTFIEDSFDESPAGFVATETPQSLSTKVATLQAAAARAGVVTPITTRVNTGSGIQLVQTGDAIQSIASASASITTAASQPNPPEQVMSAQLGTIVGLCGTLDRHPALKAQGSSDTFLAMMEVWAAAAKLRRDLLAQGDVLRVYTTTVPMTVDQVSVYLYGDVSHVLGLLRANSFADALDIPANTAVLYYAAA